MRRRRPNPVHALVLPDLELKILRNAPVVFQRLGAIGLVVEAGHRDVADFEQLRRGEERHIGGVVIDRVHHAPLFDQHRLQAALLEFDPACEAGRPGADHQRIEGFGHSFSRSWRTFANAASRADTSLPPPSAMSGRPPPLPPTAWASAPANFPAWNLPVRSFLTAATIEMLPSSAEASTTTPVFWLRNESATDRICCRSIPSTRSTINGTPLSASFAFDERPATFSCASLFLSCSTCFCRACSVASNFSTCSTSSGSPACTISAMRRTAPVVS